MTEPTPTTTAAPTAEAAVKKPRRTRWRKHALLVSLISLGIIWQDELLEWVKQEIRQVVSGPSQPMVEAKPLQVTETQADPLLPTTGDQAEAQPIPTEPAPLPEPQAATDLLATEIPAEPAAVEATAAADNAESESSVMAVKSDATTATDAATEATEPRTESEAAASNELPAITEATAATPENAKPEETALTIPSVEEMQIKELRRDLKELHEQTRVMAQEIDRLKRPKLMTDPRLTLMVGLWQLQQKLLAGQPFETEWNWLKSQWEQANQQAILSLPPTPRAELMDRYAPTGLPHPAALLEQWQEVSASVGGHYPDQSSLWQRGMLWVKRQFNWQPPLEKAEKGNRFAATDVENYLNRIRHALQQDDRREAARLASELQEYHNRYNSVPPMPLAKFLDTLTTARQLEQQIDDWMRQFLQAATPAETPAGSAG